MKKSIGAVIFVALNLVLLALPNPYRVEAAGARVIFFSGSSPHYTPLFIADSQGFFKEEGLELQLVTFSSGVAALEAFRAGKGHFVATFDAGSLRLWEGGDVVGVAPFENDDEGNIIIAQRNIKKASDLKGKAVGVTLKSTSEFLLRKYLEIGGVSPKDVKMINMVPQDTVIAIDKGEISAFSAWQPFGFQSLDVSGDKVHVLTTGKGFYTSYGFVSTTKEYAKAQPDAVKALVKALVKARNFIQANPERTASIVSDRLKLQKEMVKKMYEFMRWDVTYTPELRASVRAVADFLLEQGTLKGRTDLDSAFDSRFLKAVAPSLVK